MQKEVLIHVRGLQMMDAQGDQEPIEIIVPGQYYFRNGSHYLRYEELLDETAEPTINYIKVSGKGLEVSKKGLVNVHMVFEQGKKNKCLNAKGCALCSFRGVNPPNPPKKRYCQSLPSPLS